jgi:glutamyl/glutaminyl-tRNA synthetase
MRLATKKEDSFQNIEEALLHCNNQWDQLKCVTSDRVQKHECVVQRLSKTDL